MMPRGCRPGLVLLSSLVLLGAAARAEDFSGSWQIDVTRSTEKAVPLDPAGPPPPPPSPGGTWQSLSPETITQAGEALTIQGGTGPVLTLSTDGRESLNTAPDGTVHRSTTRWEGRKLVTTWTLEDKGEVRAHGTDVRWLEDGGKVLVNDRTRRSRWMEITLHIVWVRQR